MAAFIDSKVPGRASTITIYQQLNAILLGKVASVGEFSWKGSNTI